MWFEPVFFIFFGLVLLSRVWAFIDKQGYADFLLGLMFNEGLIYNALMGAMAVLCIAGVATFFKFLGHNYWWRWMYLCGGGYVLFDLFAIAIHWPVWQRLLLAMFDVDSMYWSVIWGVFVAVGLASLALGIVIIRFRNCAARTHPSRSSRRRTSSP